MPKLADHRRPAIKTEDFADYVRDLAGELRASAERLGMRGLAEALSQVCEEAAAARASNQPPGNAAPDDAA